ncbi:MAG: tetratricopeptide repeat protein [Ktedonobacteraceae bacterium]|nr:tetratricopeptide repeat protein [Ktedonobacteraceae bacterium]
MTSRLRFQRERRGWSRATLAELLGTTSATVAQWEEGFSAPPQPFQEKLLTLFGLEDHSVEPSFSRLNADQHEDVAFLLLPQAAPTFPATISAPSQRESNFLLDPFLSPPFKDRNNLVGRAGLFLQLKQHLLLYHSVALSGLPGVGKTALAIALAYDPEIRAQFSDGVLWAGLGLSPHLPGLFRRWGKVLGATLQEEEPRSHRTSWLPLLQGALGRRRLLLILDDVWQAELVADLQALGACCGYVLTTRMAHIAAQLTGERALQIPELEEPDAVQLLTRFVPELLQYETEIAHQLVRAVGGHPLALTLMSKYLGSNAIMGQPRRLHAALTRLLDAEQRLRLYLPQVSPENVSSPTLEVSLGSVITISYLQLPERARQALLALAVLPVKPARLTRHAVLAVTNVPLDVLDLLCDAELLERYRDVHYMLHPLIADYLRAQGPPSEASVRLIKYGIDFIQTQSSDASALEHESSMLLAALDCAWKLEQWEDLLVGCNGFVPFLLRWGWYTLAEQLLQRASIAALQNGNRYYRICLLEQLSTLAHVQGNYALAQKLAHQGLHLARQAEYGEKIIALYALLGGSSHELGNYTQAESYYQEGLVLARQYGSKQQISTLLKNLGVVARKRGNYALAQLHYQEGLGLARQLENTDLLSLLLMNLGVIATERGDYALAQAYYQEGLTLARQFGSREQLCVLLSNLGVLAEAQGNYSEAEALLNEGLAEARELGHRECLSLLLLNRGTVSNREGKDNEAEVFYLEGLALARQLEHSERISSILLNLGELIMERGQLDQAGKYFQEGLALARHLEHRQLISDQLLHLGMVGTRQGEFSQAESALVEGLHVARQLDHPQLICRHLAAWGKLQLQMHHIEVAESAFLEMLDLVPSGGRAMIAHAQYGLASVAASRRQFKQAGILAQRSYATFEQLGDREKKMVQAFLEHLPQRTEEES